MFCSRKSNNLINKTQERTLKLTYKRNTKTIETLLIESNENSIHQRNSHVLMTKIYKIKNKYAPPRMHFLFQFRKNRFNLRNF